jgi:cbb3-type cytochrome oxidase cytochrome c subunit
MNQSEVETNIREADHFRMYSPLYAERMFWSGYQIGLRTYRIGEKMKTTEWHQHRMSEVNHTDKSLRMRGFGYLAGCEALDIEAATAFLGSADYM